jgi:hypothetical protein
VPLVHQHIPARPAAECTPSYIKAAYRRTQKEEWLLTHSPALSAFGMRPPSRASPGFDRSFDSPTVGTPPLVHVSPQKSDAGRSIASGSTTLFDISTRTLRGLPTPPRSNSGSPLSANFQLNPAPWVGGLAHDWQPAP